MRAIFRVFFLLLGLVLCSESVFACTCGIDSLSKRFRRAEAIFVGHLADGTGIQPTDIQNYQHGRAVLEVNKSWKGIQRKFVAVEFKLNAGEGGGCPQFWQFESGRDYFVFAYGKELKIEVTCSETKPVGIGYSKDEIERMDSFWFRTKARLCHFNFL